MSLSLSSIDFSPLLQLTAKFNLLNNLIFKMSELSVRIFKGCNHGSARFYAPCFGSHHYLTLWGNGSNRGIAFRHSVVEWGSSG